MDDYPTKIADFLESTAHRVRSLSVDRVRNVALWAAVGMVLTVLGLILFVFLLVGLFRLLAGLMSVELAYTVLGGLFLLIGAFLWSRRIPKTTEARTIGEDTNA